jgi:hypothetical protein
MKGSLKGTLAIALVGILVLAPAAGAQRGRGDGGGGAARGWRGVVGRGRVGLVASIRRLVRPAVARHQHCVRAIGIVGERAHRIGASRRHGACCQTSCADCPGFCVFR